MIYEFDTFVRIEAEDPDEARDKLIEWIAAPMPNIYSIGLESFDPRDVTLEDAA